MSTCPAFADSWLDRLSLDDEQPAPVKPAKGPATDDEIAAYIAALNARSVESFNARGYGAHMSPRVYAIDPGGRKFLRVTASDGGSGKSAFLFIEVATGDLYKPASWKGPERNFPRGNIRDLRPTAVACDRYI